MRQAGGAATRGSWASGPDNGYSTIDQRRVPPPSKETSPDRYAVAVATPQRRKGGDDERDIYSGDRRSYYSPATSHSKRDYDASGAKYEPATPSTKKQDKLSQFRDEVSSLYI